MERGNGGGNGFSSGLDNARSKDIVTAIGLGVVATGLGFVSVTMLKQYFAVKGELERFLSSHPSSGLEDAVQAGVVVSKYSPYDTLGLGIAMGATALALGFGLGYTIYRMAKK